MPKSPGSYALSLAVKERKDMAIKFTAVITVSCLSRSIGPVRFLVN